MKFTKKDYTFEDLIGIMKVLRSDGGCPWDKEQTHQSIKYSLLEEACEAMEALDTKAPDDFADELGDVLLQVVFHAEIAEENNTFSMQDVLNHICNKLVFRHTHIFSDDSAESADEVLNLWEQNKRLEKAAQGINTQTAVMQDVCSYLPALMRAAKVQKKAADVGFDWEDQEGAIEKLEEEIQELKEAIASKKASDIEEELGDLLFSCVNVSRFLSVNPENALKKATNKFINRFSMVEQMAAEKGLKLEAMSLEEMDVLWDIAKKQV